MLIQIIDHLDNRDQLSRSHKGIVIANNDPKQLGRVKAFVKGVLEGDAESLPWCTPILPSVSGGSPSSITLDVPDIGSEIEVSFLSGNVYTPVYRGVWPSENMGIRQLFGEDYPHTFGKIDASGSIRRSNSLRGGSESYHPSGFLSRVGGEGNYDLSVPGDLNIKVDGEFSINGNYWQNGGGGIGNVIDELTYAVIDGPFIRGLIDIAALLPGGTDPNSPGYIGVDEFAQDLDNLFLFASSLDSLDPEMTDLASKMALIKNPDQIQRSFLALNGVEGLSNILYSFFGIFGVWNALWLKGSQDVVNATILGLRSEITLKKILRGRPSDLEEILGYVPSTISEQEAQERLEKAQSDLTKEIIKKMRDGFEALSVVGGILKLADRLRKAIQSRGPVLVPRHIIALLDDDLRAFVEESITSLFRDLMETVEVIDFKTQMTFLDRFGLAEYFSTPNSSVDKIRRCLAELLALGISPYELGLYGNVLGVSMIREAVAKNQSREQFLELATSLGVDVSTLLEGLAKKDFEENDPNHVRSKEEEEKYYETQLSRAAENMIRLGIFKDKIMECLDSMRMDVPIAVFAEEKNGVKLKNTKYLDASAVAEVYRSIYDLRNDSRSSDGSIGKGDADGIIDLSEDLANAGEGDAGKGTIISGEFLSFMGEAIGSLARAEAFKGIADKYLGEDLANLIDGRESNGVVNPDENPNDKSIGLVYVINEVYNWFTRVTISDLSERSNKRVIAKEMNAFLVGLDFLGLYESAIPTNDIFFFVRRLTEIARPRAIFASGANVHQILSSGFAPIVFEDLSKRLKRIEEEVYKFVPDYVPVAPWFETSESLSEGTYYPKTFWYNLVFGNPNHGNSRGRLTINRRVRDLGILSRRMQRLDAAFKAENVNYVRGENESNHNVVRDTDVPGLIDLRSSSVGREE